MLFDAADLPLDWQQEWVGMPEFTMGNTEPFQKITVSFACWDDVRRFGEVLGLSVTSRTDSVWYPRPDNYEAPSSFRYVDES